MDYRIIAANAATGQIEVTYSIEGVDVATYTLDVPIVDGKYITGPELEAEIQARAPIWILERKQAIAVATGFDTIAAQVVPEPVQAVVAPVVAVTTTLGNIASTSSPAPITAEPVSVTVL